MCTGDRGHAEDGNMPRTVTSIADDECQISADEEYCNLIHVNQLADIPTRSVFWLMKEHSGPTSEGVTTGSRGF